MAFAPQTAREDRVVRGNKFFDTAANVLTCASRTRIVRAGQGQR